MSVEITKYDDVAKYLYELHKYDKKLKDGWPNFHHLKRKDRDYWRALAQVATEKNPEFFEKDLTNADRNPI